MSCVSSIILKKSNGSDGYYLIKSSAAELLCGSITNGAIGEGSFLLSENISCLDAEIDRRDTLHAVFSDSGGSITYLCRTADGKWLKKLIFEAEQDSDSYSPPFVHITQNGDPCVVYTAFTQGTASIRIQYISGSADTPIELDTISKENNNIFSVRSGSGKIYVFYTAADGSFGYKSISETAKRVSGYEKIEERARQVRSFYACCRAGKIYICYKTNGGIRFRILDGNGTLSPVQQLTRRHTDSSSPPILSFLGDELRLLWFDNGYVICGNCDISASSWSRLDEKRLIGKDRAALFKLCCAYSEDVRHNFGYIDDKKLFLFDENDFFEGLRQAPAGTQKSSGDDESRRLEIERQKALIMEKMGLPKRTADLPNSSMVAENTAAAKENSARAVRGDLIEKELSALHSELESIRGELEKLRCELGKHTAKTKQKIILAKVHKK